MSILLFPKGHVWLVGTVKNVSIVIASIGYAMALTQVLQGYEVGDKVGVEPCDVVVVASNFCLHIGGDGVSIHIFGHFVVDAPYLL